MVGIHVIFTKEKYRRGRLEPAKWWKALMVRKHVMSTKEKYRRGRLEAAKGWKKHDMFTIEKYLRGRLFTCVPNKFYKWILYRLHKTFSRAETIDSENESGCLASWMSRFVKNPLHCIRVVLESLRVDCESPSSQASRNDYRPSPLTDVHIPDDSTSDAASEDHHVESDTDVADLHSSKQSTTRDTDDTCHLHSHVPCAPPDVIMDETSATPPRNWAKEFGTCEEKHAENRVENHEGTPISGSGNLSPQPGDRDILENNGDLESLPEELRIHILKGLGYEKLCHLI